MSTMAPARTVTEVKPETLRDWLAAGQAVLVDVRPADRFAAERIAGAVSLSLPAVGRSALPEVGGRKLVFQCEVGMASDKAARKLLELGWDGEVHNLAGGIRAWKRAGLPVERSADAGLSLPRQVQITAGSLVLLGAVLGVGVSRWFFLIPGFIGAGLVFAGASGTCGMAALLARLPHNRANLSV